jgi:hypothetical protein
MVGNWMKGATAGVTAIKELFGVVNSFLTWAAVIDNFTAYEDDTGFSISTAAAIGAGTLSFLTYWGALYCHLAYNLEHLLKEELPTEGLSVNQLERKPLSRVSQVLRKLQKPLLALDYCAHAAEVIGVPLWIFSLFVKNVISQIGLIFLTLLSLALAFPIAYAEFRSCFVTINIINKNNDPEETQLLLKDELEKMLRVRGHKDYVADWATKLAIVKDGFTGFSNFLTWGLIFTIWSNVEVDDRFQLSQNAAIASAFLALPCTAAAVYTHFQANRNKQEIAVHPVPQSPAIVRTAFFKVLDYARAGGDWATHSGDVSNALNTLISFGLRNSLSHLSLSFLCLFVMLSGFALSWQDRNACTANLEEMREKDRHINGVGLP